MLHSVTSLALYQPALSWLPFFFQPIQTSGLLCALLNVILVCVSVSAPREPFCFLSLSWFPIPHFSVCPLVLGDFNWDGSKSYFLEEEYFVCGVNIIP